MMAKRKKNGGKGQLSTGLTRRNITENRISHNIMNYNQPVATSTFNDMELSVDYHTQVSQHKYMQTDFLPLMNLQILSKMPLDQLMQGQDATDPQAKSQNVQKMGIGTGFSQGLNRWQHTGGNSFA